MITNRDTMLRIVVDAMGGRNAPAEIVQGVAEASLTIHNAEIILVGDAAVIGELLPRVRHDGARIRVHHATSFVPMDDPMMDSLPAEPNTSIMVAAELVARGEGDCLISAGNSVASVLACSHFWKRIPGVSRPALTAVYPTELHRGKTNDPFSLILDVGATVDATAEDLVCFAVMGAEYARAISRNQRPRIALLSNSRELSRAPSTMVTAHQMLAERTDLNFIGLLEGLDVPRGVADVVVCSGYVGNIVINMLEGTSNTVLRLARYASKQQVLWRIGLGLLSTGLDRIKKLTDWRQYGGSPLLGYNHLFIKADQSSGGRAIANAVRVVLQAHQQQLNPTILASMDAFLTRKKRTAVSSA